MILRLILGDQLNPEHSWFHSPDPDVQYVMMEVRQETDYVLHHAQKLVAVLAGMRDFARMLRLKGHVVHYMQLDDADNRQEIVSNLLALISRLDAKEFQYQEPDEWRLDQQLAEFSTRAPVPVRMVDSEHFITSRHEAARFFRGRKQWVMENFYRHLRKQHSVLMQDGDPAGGQWNFDSNNRKSWPGKPAAPADNRPVHDHSALFETIEQSGARSFGQSQAAHFRWPLNRSEALGQLDHFLDNALPQFGDFQDAMHSANWRMFHALISFALNTKMLCPREVIEAAEQRWQQQKAPIHSVEGFIRQILGWREYIRGFYWSRMPGYLQENQLDHSTELPGWFWTGQTRMNCLSECISTSLENAYAHHIQRLMVIGSFSLMAGLSPQALHRWYLGIYIDAFEWVELPNTVGMSQFADGGQLATKPYACSASYINRMSNYCKQCHYDKSMRTGERACPFNALYWNFYLRHKSTLQRNPRIGMAYRQLEKMPAEEVKKIEDRAEFLLHNLNDI